jgi:heavy metal efflux system protein
MIRLLQTATGFPNFYFNNMDPMINRIIDFSVKNKFLVGLFTLALILWGVYSLMQLPVDAVPDITNNQVQVISIAPTLATQEVEKYITTPIEMSLSTIPDVVERRSISRLGLSVVTIVFKDRVDIYKARQQIGERLKEAEEQIPPGLTKPELAPVSTGLGEIYQYLVKPGKGYEKMYSLTDLRTIQDWIVKRELLGTPGVAEVNSYGGFVKEYEVAINPDRLRSMDVSVMEIFEALEKNNENTGSAYIEKSPASYFIRGIGTVGSLEDIGKIVVKMNPDLVPVLIRDLATVQYGHAIRYGAFVCDTSEAVGGVVMMLKGANASQVIRDVKERMKVIGKSLPEGVTVQPYLDRTDLVDRAIGTVTKNLLEGGLIVIFILVLFLGNMRAGLVVASVIPLSMLFAISMMNILGISGNLMSLGAIDFGLIIDGAVIIVENVVHRITKSRTALSRQQIEGEVSTASKRMMNSAVFGQAIILIVYLPILTLVGIEGKMFRPMAQTVGLAILGALILSLTYVPMVSALVLRRKPKEKRNFSDSMMKILHKGFDPVILIAFRNKAAVLVVSLLLFIASLALFGQLGGEFIPNLEEGDLASGIMTLQGGSLTNTVETVKKANKILLDNFPEVKHAVCKIGAGEIPTDPTPVETGDYIITMKDKKEWTTASSREELVEKMKEKVSEIPGVDFSFQQPIQMRFNELMTGSKQDVAVKIFGDDLDSLAQQGERLANLIKNIEGLEDIQVEKVTGSPQITVVYNREKIARYGLNIADVNRILRTAFAGSVAGVVREDEKRFDLVVRFEEPYRKDIENVRKLFIPVAGGRQVPLDEVAKVDVKVGTAQVSREDARRRITVGFNVRGRDVRSIIDQCRTVTDSKMHLPPGYYITYGGQFENLVEAQKRLSLAVPVALVLIFVLLYFALHSVRQTLMVFTAVPLAAIGGIVALYLRGMNFSISAGVGFIALFGVAVLNGIVLIAEFNRLAKEEKIHNIHRRVLHGLKIRFRPVNMTAAVASLGFLPMAMSHSAGAEVQKPLATVVIGGLISSTLLTLIVLPVLYLLFSEGKKKIKSGMNGKSLTVLFFLVPATLLLPQFGLAQPKTAKLYNLDQAVARALSANGTVKIGTLETAGRKALRQSAWDIPKTSVGFSYGQMNSDAMDDELVVSQELSFPSVYANQHRLAKLGVAQSEILSQQTRNEVIAQVRSAYFELSYYLARMKLLQFEDSLLGTFARAAQLRFLTGESNLLEKVTAETQSLAVKNRMRMNLSEIRIRKCQLQVLLNEKEEIDIPDSVLTKLPLRVSGDTDVVRVNPGLRLLEQQIQMEQVGKQIEISRLLPDLSVGYFNQSMKEISSGNRFDGFQAGVAIPLAFASQKGKIESAKIGHEIAVERYNYERDVIYHQVHILFEDCMKYKESLDYFEQSAMKQSDLILTQAGKSFRAGDIDYMEYVQNLRQGIEIRDSYLETLNQYNQAVIAIESLIPGN